MGKPKLTEIINLKARFLEKKIKKQKYQHAAAKLS